MDRSEFVRRMNDLVAAVSNQEKEYARAILSYFVLRCLDSTDREYFVRRLADELMVAWYDTYRKDGAGPWLPREAAGIPSRKEP